MRNLRAIAIVALAASVCAPVSGAVPRSKLDANAPATQPAVAWGAAANGVQAGLRATKAAFEPRETIELEIHLKNAGDKAATLTNAASALIAWQVTFAAKDGKGTWLARWTKAAVARLRPMPMELGKGEEKVVKLEFDASWEFEDQSPRLRGKPVAPLKSLGEGVYRVQAAYTQGRPADAGWWGTLMAGPAEMRVGKEAEPRGKPDGNTPTTAPTSRAAVSGKQIAEWIEQLGDKDWKVREAATEKLITAGKAARAPLEAKLKEKGLDPEVTARVERILEQTGGVAGSAADVRKLLEATFDDDPKAREKAVRQMQGLAPTAEVMKALRTIAAGDSSQEMRQAAQRMLAEMEKKLKDSEVMLQQRRAAEEAAGGRN